MKQDILRFVKGFPWGVWARGVILHWKNVEEIGCALSSYFNITWEEKYGIIETDSRRERCKKIEEAVYEFMEVFHVGEEAEEAQKEIHEQAYRESAIKKQIELLQQQLDEMHPENISDVRKFETKIAQSGMNEEARKEAEKVLNRMKQEGKDSHEYGMLYDYLDFVTSLSWKTKEQSEIDLQEAEKILDEDHYGLKKVKERIIQQLAVMALNKKQSGSILLFVGAPGTGKTSIGQSIAKALHREYVRISLGGIRDEAEIRGHRRTYVGAMPGRIMEGMKRSKAQNPVMVLDEVDKLAKDYGGDPASALLEVLDPEQNYSFTDHYMNVPYDLSNVFFVCTANSTDTAVKSYGSDSVSGLYTGGEVPYREETPASESDESDGNQDTEPEGYGWCPGENNRGIYRRVRCARVKETGGCNLQACCGQTGQRRAKKYYRQ